MTFWNFCGIIRKIPIQIIVIFSQSITCVCDSGRCRWAKLIRNGSSLNYVTNHSNYFMTIFVLWFWCYFERTLLVSYSSLTPSVEIQEREQHVRQGNFNGRTWHWWAQRKGNHEMSIRQYPRQLKILIAWNNLFKQ